MPVTCESSETCIHETTHERKRCRERRVYNANREEERRASRCRSRSRRRLLVLDPTMTCVMYQDGPHFDLMHECSGKTECHHLDGDYTNTNDENLVWACRNAHELLDMQIETRRRALTDAEIRRDQFARSLSDLSNEAFHEAMALYDKAETD